MHVTIKSLTGKFFDLLVDPNDSIQDVKQKITDREGVPPSEQRLIFSRQTLDDDLTLSDYNIQPNSVISLVIRF